MSALDVKCEVLRDNLHSAGRIAVAFSGGVDSTLLLHVAHDVLGDNAVAITACLHSLDPADLDEARLFCKRNGIQHIEVPLNELEVPGFRENPPDRCYLCKKSVFGSILETARAAGFPIVAEGSNMDDLDDYRPGSRAIRELAVKSPLLEAGFTKEDVRELSRRLGLPTWSKPSAACLASRFAYGETITDEGLARVAAGEAYLRERGFNRVRVRIHGNLARIEVEPERVVELLGEPLRADVLQRMKELGFAYTTIDLTGYRMGSMNEALSASS